MIVRPTVFSLSVAPINATFRGAKIASRGLGMCRQTSCVRRAELRGLIVVCIQVAAVAHHLETGAIVKVTIEAMANPSLARFAKTCSFFGSADHAGRLYGSGTFSIGYSFKRQSVGGPVVARND
jgi:hypothetical protein